MTGTDRALPDGFAAAVARMDECRAGCDAGEPFYADARAWDTIHSALAALASDTGERGVVVVEIVECEDCGGSGVIGMYPGSDFQPPEPEMCRSCGGSGKWRITQPQPAALRAQPAGGGEVEAFVRGYKHGACHYIGGDNTEELDAAARWASEHQSDDADVFTPPESGGQGELIPPRDAPAEELWAAIYRLNAIAYRVEDGKPWMRVAAQLRMEAKTGVTVTDAMVDAALKVEAFERDGALWPDAYSSEEQVMERGFMRKTLAAALAQGAGNER